jgi:hypothetical protein
VASYVFNISRGHIAEMYSRITLNDPNTSAFVVSLLQANEAVGTLVDHDTLASLLAANTIATFTNYVRKSATDSNLAALPAPDDSNDKLVLQFPSQTWLNAGGATNNNLTMAIISYAPDVAGADSTIIPCVAYDYVTTTNGTDITISWPNGFWQST